MDLNQVVAYSLRAGVFASAVLSVLGIILWAAHGFGTLGSARIGLVGIIGAALAGDESGIIYLAVVLLIATPIFRVVVSTAYFAKEQDRKYVGITLVVLAMLVFALLSGAGA